MTVPIHLRATKDTRDLLDTTLTAMTANSGWRRTFPADVNDIYMVVPNYNEIMSFIEYGSEDTTAIRALGYGGYTPTKPHPIHSDWINYFYGCMETHDATFPDRTVHRIENRDANRYKRIRLSPQELIDMKIWDLGFMRNDQHYELEDPQGNIRERNKLGSIALLLPVLPESHEFTPLQATHFLYEANEHLFEACYLGEVTYGELLAVLPEWDAMRDYMPRYMMAGEEQQKGAAKFAELIKGLRGRVSQMNLIKWAAVGYFASGTVDELAKLSEYITPERAWEFMDVGILTIADINKFVENNIDFSIATSLTNGSFT